VRPNVLLVDDSPFFRTLVAPQLMAAGYDVTEAGNAELALRLMGEGKSFDIILSDIAMPGMDGRQFAAAVKRDPGWRATPVVGLAAESDGNEPGVFDALTRKFDREGLIQTINGFIHSEERAA
jgi:two-component system chemotaxis sensor kinase CheA